MLSREGLLRLLLPVLVLSTHFAAFAAYQRYPLVTAEVLFAWLPLLGFGLALGALLSVRSTYLRTAVLALLLAWSAQQSVPVLGFVFPFAVAFLALVWIGEQLLPILAVTYAAFSIVVVVFPPAAPQIPVPPTVSDQRDESLPPRLHVVLDEHIGIAGLPTDLEGGAALAAELRNFYAERGFRVHERAYSQYDRTPSSLANLLNLSSVPRVGHYFANHEPPFELMKNGYFSQLHQEGYALRVSQSDYLDFCSASPVPLENCSTYPVYSLRSVLDQPLSAWQAGRFIRAGFLKAATPIERLHFLYDHLRDRGLTLPEWSHGPRGTGPLPSILALDALKAEFATGTRGRTWFAHLMLPHNPYVYDETCQLRADVGTWDNAWHDERKGARQNTPDTRRRRYSGYFAQIRCQQLQLAELIEAFERANPEGDATILLHGDHGSRIANYWPRLDTETRMTARDAIDAFSTHFAVRGPGLVAQAEAAPTALQDLLAEVLGEAPVVGDPAFVYLVDPGSEALTRRPLPPF